MLDESEIEAMAGEVYQRFTARKPPVKVEFYAYTGVKHTIRKREGHVYIRVSDLFIHVPAAVVEALLVVLIAKIEPGSIPDGVVRFRNMAYNQYVNSPEFLEISAGARRERVVKQVSGAAGKHHDLDAMFERINAAFFSGTMVRPTLTWSTDRTSSRMGHQDGALNTIVISLSLDEEDVPPFVVEYVIYHELLHFVHPPSGRFRRAVHPPEFEGAVRRFPRWEEAERWLTKVATRERRRKPRRGSRGVRRG